MKSTEPTKASRKKKSTKHARPSASFDDSDPDYLDSQFLSKTTLTEPTATSSQKGKKTKKRARPSASLDDSDPDYLDSQVLSKTTLTEPAATSSQKGKKTKKRARPSASLDDSDLDYLDSQVLSDDSDPDYLDSQALSKTILSEPAVQSTPVSVPAPVPPKRYKGYVYVPVEELVSNETQPTNTNPENGKPQRQRRLPKKCLEFVYD